MFLDLRLIADEKWVIMEHKEKTPRGGTIQVEVAVIGDDTFRVHGCDDLNAFKVHSLSGTMEADGTYSQHGQRGDAVVRSLVSPRDVGVVQGDVLESLYQVVV